jgi:hypothetical protein
MNIIISFVVGATLIYLITEQKDKDRKTENAHKLHNMCH